MERVRCQPARPKSIGRKSAEARHGRVTCTFRNAPALLNALKGLTEADRTS